MQHAIFISYRREDAPDAVGRVYDKLAAAFGEAAVFKDIDALSAGEDFGEAIADVVAKCRVTLALIGPAWAEALVRRRGDQSDWVQIELEAALKTPSVQVIPVLLSGGKLPSAEHLPESLFPLLRLHAVDVRRDPDFHRDMERLVSKLSALGLVRSYDISGAVGLWRELSQSEDIEDLRRFIDTFGGTPQAFEARRRVDQLLMVKDIRWIGAYLERVDDEDDDAAWLLIDGVDVFKRCWTSTSWDKELARLQELAMKGRDDLGLACYEHSLGPGDDALAETLESWRNRANRFFAKLGGEAA